MKSELPIRLVLIDPPMKIDYGLQRGRGSNYEAVFVQQSKGGNVTFDFSIAVSEHGKDSSPNFSGEFVQGTPARRFIYVDVGAYAGQKNTPWSRRMIVRLDDIGWPVIRKAIKPGQRLEAKNSRHRQRRRTELRHGESDRRLESGERLRAMCRH